MAHHLLLDHRFPTLNMDQQHALKDLYKSDRKRGWPISDARYYINAVVDHAVARRASHS